MRKIISRRKKVGGQSKCNVVRLNASRKSIQMYIKALFLLMPTICCAIIDNMVIVKIEEKTVLYNIILNDHM